MVVPGIGIHHIYQYSHRSSGLSEYQSYVSAVRVRSNESSVRSRELRSLCGRRSDTHSLLLVMSPTRPPGDMGSSTGPVGCVVLRLDGFPSTELGGLRVGVGGTQLALVS